MRIGIQTPTGTPFEFEINHENQTILIISSNNNQHEYSLTALKDLYDWLKIDNNSQWVLLGTQGEENEPAQNTVEEGARSPNNPNNGFVGITAGRRGLFASYVPSILEHFGFLEVEHNARNNRVRAIT